jgi:hypothetical protein
VFILEFATRVSMIAYYGPLEVTFIIKQGVTFVPSMEVVKPI